jgi:hypothetical protein
MVMTKNSSDQPQELTASTQESNQDSGTAPREFTMEELEHIMPDKHQRDSFLRLVGHLEDDRAAVVTLKGHLVLEEKITAAIEKFVFHSEHLDAARLTFAQKLASAVYTKETGGKLEDWEKNDEALLVLSSVSQCLGFLDAFEQEVERFKQAVNMLDRVVNPHRHPAQNAEHNSGNPE